VRRVSHWDPKRWAGRVHLVDQPPGPPPPAPADAPRRGDLLFAVVQELADAGADAEHRRRQDVPRLANDYALTDQLRVMVADLIEARPADDVLDRAARLITRTAQVL
jgi:hypothetical protein